MAQAVEGQRPRHKQWLGAHGPQPTTIMKYRIPENLVKHIIERLGEESLRNSKDECSHSSNGASLPNIAVVTRHGTETQNEPQSQVPESPFTPLHPSRSTLGRKREAQHILRPEFKVEDELGNFEEHEEVEVQEEADTFDTPP